jgi:ATP-binding cassette, subfamily F, member 2
MGRSAKAAKQQKQKAQTARKSGTKENTSVNELTDSVSSVSIKDGGYASTDVVNLLDTQPTTDEMLSSHIARTCTGNLASQTNSRDVKIESFSLQFYGKKLIENTSIELTFGRRYGLLGPNGCGKSTFLKALAAREVPIPEHIDIFCLSEEFARTDMSGLDAVIAEARKEVARLEEVMDHIIETDGPGSPLLDDIYYRLETMDPETFESRAALILTGLGFSNEMMRRATKDMSGGWRMRVSLARALFIRPTLLLLYNFDNYHFFYLCV